MAKERTTGGSRRGNGGSPGRSAPQQPPLGRRELIVIAAAEARLQTGANGVISARGADVAPLARLLAGAGASLQPLFGVSEGRLRAEMATQAASLPPGTPVPDLSLYYYVDAPEAALDSLANELRQQPAITAAYVKPAAELAVIATAPAALAPPPQLQAINAMLPLTDEAPVTTPNFVDQQIYLNPAPEGIDAHFADTIAGGRGAGVRVIDLEWGWRFTHEDLAQNQGGVISGTPTLDQGAVDHGTAVLGEISGDQNGYGITGIAPDATISAVAFSMPSANAIRIAADQLRPGDIMLLEIHRPGPRHGFATRADQLGYIAIEWWPDDFDAIRYAINRGVIVVEAAGNGAENLDDAIYATRPSGFPATWTNPFNRVNRDSGAIVVGAGAPPPGTHGRTWGPDRSRLDFSNYGELVDAQGWGREVTTTGYGNLQAGMSQDTWYTDTFAGTSSASPIVVGAIAATQGALLAQGRIPLTPARARDLLRATGSPQQSAPGRPASQRIGNRPNLRQLIPLALETNQWVGVQFRGMVAAGQSQRWFTFNWPVHWHVVWTVVPTTPRPGSPQIRWQVQVERANDRFVTYWISVTNISPAATEIEARFAVLGW